MKIRNSKRSSYILVGKFHIKLCLSLALILLCRGPLSIETLKSINPRESEQSTPFKHNSLTISFATVFDTTGTKLSIRLALITTVCMGKEADDDDCGEEFENFFEKGIQLNMENLIVLRGQLNETSVWENFFSVVGIWGKLHLKPENPEHHIWHGFCYSSNCYIFERIERHRSWFISDHYFCRESLAKRELYIWVPLIPRGTKLDATNRPDTGAFRNAETAFPNRLTIFLCWPPNSGLLHHQLIRTQTIFCDKVCCGCAGEPHDQKFVFPDLK